MIILRILFLQETAMSNAWYEVLSVLHLMAMVLLFQANIMLLPRTSTNSYPPTVCDGTYSLTNLACYLIISRCLYIKLCETAQMVSQKHILL